LRVASSLVLLSVRSTKLLALLLRSHGTAVSGDWFALYNVASLGTCGTYSGMVIVRIADDDRGKRHFAALLAARSQGATVSIAIDYNVKDSGGYCFLRYMDF
jgi:hypothetical protein